MARVKRGMAAHAKHNKVLKLAKGFRGRSSKAFRPALERLEKAWQYAYRDRRNKKRNARALWIQRINAAVRELGMKYSTFMNGLKKAKVSVDRKILAKLAVENPEVLKTLVSKSKSGPSSKKIAPKTSSVEKKVETPKVSSAVKKSPSGKAPSASRKTPKMTAKKPAQKTATATKKPSAKKPVAKKAQAKKK